MHSLKMKNTTVIISSNLKGDGHLDHLLGSKSQDDPLKVSQPSVEFLAARSSFGG